MSQFPSYNSQEGIPRAPADRLAREAAHQQERFA